jgi:hypothetical protein
MANKPCPDCAAPVIVGNRGDGRCATCYGGGKTGTILDDIAGGKPACQKCGGSGRCPTCRGQGVVSVAEIRQRPHADAELNPFDDREAIKLHCPNCGDVDWFEWRFLGKLRDPLCGHEWYTTTGVYTTKQIRAAFQLGGKLVKYFKHGISGEGAWIARGMSYLVALPLGIGIRLPVGVVMIPIQAIVAHNSHKKRTDGEKSAQRAQGSK